MKRILIIILLTVSHFGYSHDMKMAMFEIFKSDVGYGLDMSFDKLDFEKSLITSFPEMSGLKDSEARAAYIIHYIESNLQMDFNGVCITPEVQSIVYEEEYVRVYAMLPLQLDDIHTINIFNTCLIDYNEGHMNIIKVRLNGAVRTFRLSAERIRTTVEYKG